MAYDTLKLVDEKYKDFRIQVEKLGTFGVKLDELKSSVSESETTDSYRGFDIKIKYLYNKTEGELNMNAFVYYNGEVVTTDASKSTWVRTKEDIDRELGSMIRKVKDYIAREIIFNTKPSKMETNMN